MGESLAARSAQQFAYLLAALSALGPFAIDTYLPAQPAIAEALSTDIHRVEQTMGVYMAGLAIGPLLGGPASDRFGRKKVAVIGLVFFALASFLIAVSASIEQMLVLRFVQAIGGGFAVVTAAATVRDFFTGKEAARVMSMIGIIMMIAPLVAPAIGALLLEFSGWRAIFVWLGVYALVVAALLHWRLPQAERQVERGRGLTGVLKNYLAVLSHKHAMGFAVAQAFAMSCMFMFLTESSYVYIGYFGISESLFPVLFGANILTMALFNRLNLYLLRHHEPFSLLKTGMYVQLGSALTMALVTASMEIPLWALVCFIMFAVGSIGLIMANGVTCALAYFPSISGAANAVLGTCSYAMAALLTLVLTSLHDGTPGPMTLMMAVCAVSAVVVLHLFARPQQS